MAAGAEAVVRSAARIAAARGISPLVVGLTIVAFGGSMPELLVGVLASARHQADIAVGNVLGSNIANIGLVLGASALVRALPVDARFTEREMPVMFIGTGALVLLAGDGLLGRIDAALLLCAFLAFVTISVRRARAEPDTAAVIAHNDASRGNGLARGRAYDLVLLAGGVVSLLLGANFVVQAAVGFARGIGISELVVGLTIIAVGTSLPELATSIVAAYRREPEIAIGNVVGSNLFNAAAIMGASALTRPVAFRPELFGFEIPVLVASSMLLLLAPRIRPAFGRLEGALLVAAYAVFVWATVTRATT